MSIADNNHVHCYCGWKGRINDLIPKPEPKVVIPPCLECGYSHVDNGDGTSTTTMRQSAIIYGQQCKTCKGVNA